MNTVAADATLLSREHLVHALYEAAELEHNLMCTYLYAALSLKCGVEEGLDQRQVQAVAGWRGTIMKVAIEEMSHLAAVWNITAALGAAPHMGRANFPLDAGYLPAGIVVRLAPFNPDTLQHFIFLERPRGSDEPEGRGFSPERLFARGRSGTHLTPMGMDYDTVGEFYESIKQGLSRLVSQLGESNVFCGDPSLQLSGAAVGLPDVRPVICLKTALAAFDSIVRQGEGSQSDSADSHYQRFASIRAEYRQLLAADPHFQPAFPAATNPVLRRPPNPQGRVWLENPQAVQTVDLANASYGLMLRLLGYAYALPAAAARDKSAVLDIAIGLMRATTALGEHAARLPAGPSNPDCHAGISFTALRDASPFAPGEAAHRFFVERLQELHRAAQELASGGESRPVRALAHFKQLVDKSNALATGQVRRSAPAPASAASAGAVAAATGGANEWEIVRGEQLDIHFHTPRCIHARFCVTWAPKVFLANVQGPWIHPEAMPVDRLVEVAHACPSGAIQYVRRDGGAAESAPPVNLATVRESGPYAFRAPLVIDGKPAGFRATLCRCGASKNKPYCDGSHHEVSFSASGEPPTGQTDALPVRDGDLAIDPEADGPLHVTGNLEIVSGTGRLVTRVTEARLCRCGGSQGKPFCDGTHARIGFRSS